MSDHRETPSGSGYWMLSGSPDSASDSLRFGPGTYILGASREADLRLSHPTVSRRHARIICSAEGLTIEDLGSANGTEVNGNLIGDTVQLSPGDVIGLGEVEIGLDPIGVAESTAPQSVSEAGDGRGDLLGPTTIGFLRREGDELAFSPGTVIVRRGQRQDSFFVVVTGEVEILLQEGESRRRPLARLGPGATFGAESVLGDEGAAVDAVAVTDVRVLRYPVSGLDAALRESASLRSKLLGGMARHLHEATDDALDLLKGADVISRLVQGDDDPDEFVAVSARMRAIRKRIERCAGARSPVLVIGESGTGKTLAARLVHRASARSTGPLIAVNCSQLSSGNAAELILGAVNLEHSSPNVHGSGGVHFAEGGTLLLRDLDALAEPTQNTLASYMERVRSSPVGAGPDTRIVVTAQCAARTKGATRGLSQSLMACFEDVIQIPSLAERPKDILPLAEAMLTRSGREAAPRLTETARHALVAMPFRRNNVTELREVVDLASRIADDQEIGAEHIFGGVGDEGAVPGYDITGTPVVSTLAKPGVLRLLRISAAAGFAAVILLCFVAASSEAGKTANTAIWAIWEPFVFASFLLMGPLWCTVCPLSVAGRGVKRLWRFRRPPPDWMVVHGPWLAIAGFFAIVWSERIFAMTQNPMPSAVMLMVLVIAAAFFGFFYKREVWCRHLCPLGRLAVALAPSSPLQLTARNSICASTCRTHECYKGTASIPGCTVFHHPLEAGQAHHCKLCMDCVHSCPHGSVRIQARAPFRAIWSLDGNSSGVALFGYTVSLLALGLLLPARFPALAQPVALTAVCILSIVAGAVLQKVIALVLDEGRRNASSTTQVGFALMILGWGALILSQLSNIPLFAGSRIVVTGAEIFSSSTHPELSGLMVLQTGVMVLASAAALFTIRQIRLNAASDRFMPEVGRWRFVRLVFVVFTAAAIVLVV